LLAFFLLKPLKVEDEVVGVEYVGREGACWTVVVVDFPHPQGPKAKN